MAYIGAMRGKGVKWLVGLSLCVTRAWFSCIEGRSVLKALYQHIADKKIETVMFSDVFCIFLGQENGNVRICAPCIVVL